MDVDKKNIVRAEIKKEHPPETLVKIYILECEESSSSDGNVNQELVEVIDKTQGTNQGQIRDSSATRTEFQTIAPRSS